MSWSTWAVREKGCMNQKQICMKLGGISEGCFWRMSIGNRQPNPKNLEKIANAKGITTWELMKEVHEIGNEKAAKSDNFAA
jgi:hypothetical protein